MPDRRTQEDRQQTLLTHLESWIDEEELRELLDEFGSPRDMLNLIRSVKERKKAWDWTEETGLRLKIAGKWFLGIGAFAMAVNAVLAAYGLLRGWWGN